jgi:hypothetical protein
LGHLGDHPSATRKSAGLVRLQREKGRPCSVAWTWRSLDLHALRQGELRLAAARGAHEDGKMRWSRNKYKRLRSRKKAQAQRERVVKFFAH